MQKEYPTEPHDADEILIGPTFTCPLCYATEYDVELLFLHVEDNHSSEEDVRCIQSYDCTMCRIKMNTREELVIHYILSHRAARCSVCLKLFSSITSCNDHQTNHNEAKMIECNVCLRRYSDYPELKIHIYEQHPLVTILREEQYKMVKICKICKYAVPEDLYDGVCKKCETVGK